MRAMRASRFNGEWELMNKSTRLVSVLGIVTVGTLALAGCAGSASPAGGDAIDTVTVRSSGAPSGFDPAKGASVYDGIVQSAVYDTLIAHSNGEFIPGLAEAWKVTPNSVEFDIRKGITCADGTELGAEGVAKSLEYFFAPETAAPLAVSVAGTGTPTVSVDGNKVRVEVSNDYADLLAGFALPSTGIICPAGLADPSAMATEAFGTGPFTLTEQVAGSSYSFAARDEYNWGPEYQGVEGKRPAKLVVQVIEDSSTAANLLDTGELQIADFTGDEWKRFDGKGYTTTAVSQADSLLLLNQAEGAVTTDPAVREAIMQAVDRDRLNEVTTFGQGEVLDNIAGSEFRCYNPKLASLLPKYDAEAAKKALSGLDIRLLGSTSTLSGDYLLEQLGAAGANVTFDNQAPGDWVTTLMTAPNSWDVTVLHLVNTASSISYTAAYFAGTPVPNGQNLSSIVDPAADALLTESHSLEGDAQCAKVDEFQRGLFENFRVLPLNTVPTTVVVANGVTAATDAGAVLTGSIRVA